jgi:uncharacterized BrkB/YihY/UPF0761 family membrane protein
MKSSYNNTYAPSEEEANKASNSYLMSLIAFIGGLPLPIINLLATLVFYLGNRKAKGFVKWHCTQALLSQFIALPLNSACFWWTISIIFTDEKISSNYIAYAITIVAFNLAEFIATMYTAIAVNKGRHVEWWFVGGLTNLIVRT